MAENVREERVELSFRVLLLLFSVTLSGCVLLVDTRAPLHFFSVEPVEHKSGAHEREFAWTIATILESEHYGCELGPDPTQGSYWCTHSKSELFLEYEFVNERADFVIQSSRMPLFPMPERRRLIRHIDALAASFEASELSFIESPQH